MVFHDLQVWNIKQERNWIVHNPWSERPFDPLLLPFAQFIVNQAEGVLTKTEGTASVGAALQLPDPWPPEE
jgi:hypothetical protein